MPRIIREMVIIFIGLVAGIYLINPTFGLLELIPDNLPIIGNLDEAGATLILMNVLAYYGINVSGFLGYRTPPQQLFNQRPQREQKR